MIASLMLAAVAALPGFKRAGGEELFPVTTKVQWEVREDKFHFYAETEMPPEGLMKRVDKRASGASRFVSIDDSYAFGFPKKFVVNARGATSVAVEGVETESVETNGCWQFRLSVPLASVGGFPENGKLKVVRNFARVDTKAGSRAAVTLRRGKDDDPVISGCTFGKGANGYYPIAIDVTNPGKRSRFLKLSFVGSPVNSQPCEILKDFSLSAGQTRSFAAKGPVLDDEQVNWKLTLSEGKKKLFADQGVFSPNYKGSVFMRPAGLEERIGFRLAYFPSYNQLRVRVDAGELPSRAGAKLSVLAGATDEVVAEWEPKFDEQGVSDETRTIPDLRPFTVKNGNPDYVLVFKTADGTELRRIFKRYAMEWEGNKYGLSDAVVPPFEKVRREKVKVEKRGGRSEVEGWTSEGQVFDCDEVEKVGVVLRDHYIDKKTGLWQQVIAAGKPLLARPMRIVEVKRKKEKGISKDGNSAVPPSTSNLQPSSSTSAFNLNLSTKSTWDYDGCMKLQITLPPGHYEPMALEIPMKGEEATLMHTCVDGLRANYGGVVPAGQGKVWDSSMQRGRIGLIGDYLPYVWIGGCLRGISIFGDNDRGWVVGESKSESERSKSERVKSKSDGGGQRNGENSAVQPSTSNLQPQSQPSTSNLQPQPQSQHCYEIFREGDGTVVLRANLVQRAIDLKEPRTITLGLQATPIKPMPENWRARSIGTFVGATKYWGGLGGVATSDETDLFLRKFAEARKTGKIDWKFLREYLDSHVPFKGEKDSIEWKQDRENMRLHHEAGMGVASRSAAKEDSKIVFYTNARGVEYGNESGLTYMDEWSRVAWKDRNVGRRELREYELDPVASYRDYAASWYYHIFKTGAADALYWDDVYASPNIDLVGTDAYRLPDGRIQPSSGVWNMRELIRRCAVVQVELGRDPRDNWVHMTNTEIAPICAFAGVNYDWEDIYGNKPIQERYSREMILACSIGRQMGNRVSVMGYFAEKDPNSPLLKQLERGGTGACLAFELDWSRVKVWNTAIKLLNDWGYRKPDTKVWNYWDEDVKFPVEVSGGEAATLAMAKKKGEGKGGGEEGTALIVVSDWKEGGKYSIKPDCKTMGLKSGFKAFNMETGEELPVENGAVKVTLAKYDYVIIEVK